MSKRPADEKKLTDQEAKRIFTSFLFGFNDANDIDAQTVSTDSPRNGSSADETRRRLRPETSANRSRNDVKADDDVHPPRSAAEKAADQIAGFVKEDRKELRESWLFKKAYEQAQWQRDAYCVGSEYADWSKRRRQREGPAVIESRSVKSYLTMMPFGDSSASKQLAQIAANFIPTPVVKDSLLPLVESLPRTALFQPSQTALVGLVYAQQDALDRITKNAILEYLDNPTNRQSIKKSTEGYIKNYESEIG